MMPPFLAFARHGRYNIPRLRLNRIARAMPDYQILLVIAELLSVGGGGKSEDGDVRCAGGCEHGGGLGECGAGGDNVVYKANVQSVYVDSGF